MLFTCSLFGAIIFFYMNLLFCFTNSNTLYKCTDRYLKKKKKRYDIFYFQKQLSLILFAYKRIVPPRLTVI